MSIFTRIIFFHATNIHKLLVVYKIMLIFVSDMRKINRTYKFRLYPNKTQADLLARHFGCSRFVYNWGLNRKSEEYAKTKKNISCFDLIKEITLLKKEEEYKWLSEIQSQTLQMSLRCLDNAFTSFFHKKSKYPNFHKKKNRQSFQYPQGVKIKDNMIYLPKIGWIKYFKDKKIQNEKYEIIAGHNRVECSKELGKESIPAKIMNIDDDDATLIMIDTNLCSRDKISPIEKGRAYKLKLEILKL